MRLIFNGLALTNFGCFAGTHTFTLNRNPGLFFITGQNNAEPALTSNGTGKSTLINSIYWALTGKTLRQQRPGSSIESWYTKGTISISLDLSVDDKVYNITRTRKPNSLTVNGNIVEQDYVNKLIRLNEETLKRTIIIGQFVPLFLELKPEQQSSLFSEALSLDLWLRASEKASIHAKSLDSQQAKLELQQSTLNGRVTQLKLQYDLECQREKDFEANKKTKLAQLDDKLEAARLDWHIASEAFQSRYSAESHEPLSNTPNDELHATRAANGKSEQLARSIATELRIARDSQARLEKRLVKYRSDTTHCPECGQIVDQQHILTKTNELMFEISQTQQILQKLEQDYIKAQHSVDQSQQRLQVLETEYAEQHAKALEYQRERMLAEHKINNFQIAVTNTEEEIKRLQNSVNPYSAMCEKLAEEFCVLAEKTEQLEQEVAKVIEEASTYKLWTTAYKEIRLNLIDETLAELETVANRHLQALGLDSWRIEFKTERENKSGTVSHSFTTLIYPAAQEHAISFESYSGGESQRLQLAVTAALSEILLSRAGIDTNIEIFDEPTRAMSREGISDLLECLRERAVELHRSIYFVDHNSIESGYFDGTILIEKNQQGSKIV